MVDPDTEKKVPKQYKLTDDGVEYVNLYQPKEVDEEKPTKTRYG